MGRVTIHRDGSVSCNMHIYAKTHGRRKVASIQELPEPIRGATCVILASEPPYPAQMGTVWVVRGIGFAWRGGRGTTYVRFYDGWKHNFVVGG